MTRIAVTGASGFIGRHVLAALSGGDVIAHARRRVHHAQERCEWTYFDLTDLRVDAFDRLSRPQVVIHLAWGGLPNYVSSRHSEVEMPAQFRFLRKLIASGLKTLVVAGTCFEYGMQSGCLHEDMATRPSNSYGAAKDTLRRKLEHLSESNGFDLRWLRLFYLYGGGQSSTSLYSQFTAAVARGDRKFDMSPGDQLRDFMEAEDAGAAIADVALARVAPRVVNVCSGTPISVLSLVERWRLEMKSEIELNPGVFDYPAYEPFAFWGDNGRLVALQTGADSGPAAPA